MNESHFMYGIESEDDFSAVELGPFFGDVIVAHEIDEVSTRHVVHHHV